MEFLRATGHNAAQIKAALAKFEPKELLSMLVQMVTALGLCEAASAEAKAAFVDGMLTDGARDAEKTLARTARAAQSRVERPVRGSVPLISFPRVAALQMGDENGNA